jgi:hypothetical protein
MTVTDAARAAKWRFDESFIFNGSDSSRVANNSASSPRPDSPPRCGPPGSLRDMESNFLIVELWSGTKDAAVCHLPLSRVATGPALHNHEVCMHAYPATALGKRSSQWSLQTKKGSLPYGRLRFTCAVVEASSCVVRVAAVCDLRKLHRVDVQLADQHQ